MAEATKIADEELIKFLGENLGSPNAAKGGVEYIQKEYSRIPKEQKVDLTSPKQVYGGNYGTYAEKMLASGSDTIPKGENVADKINQVFGPNSHKTFFSALKKMNPAQQEAFAKFLNQFAQVEDELAKNPISTDVRRTLTRPNALTRAAGKFTQ